MGIQSINNLEETRRLLAQSVHSIDDIFDREQIQKKTTLSFLTIIAQQMEISIARIEKFIFLAKAGIFPQSVIENIDRKMNVIPFLISRETDLNDKSFQATALREIMERLNVLESTMNMSEKYIKSLRKQLKTLIHVIIQKGYPEEVLDQAWFATHFLRSSYPASAAALIRQWVHDIMQKQRKNAILYQKYKNRTIPKPLPSVQSPEKQRSTRKRSRSHSGSRSPSKQLSATFERSVRIRTKK